MSVSYRNTQWSPLVLGLLVPAIAVVGWLAVTGGEYPVVAFLALVLMALGVATASRLTVEVDDVRVTARFGLPFVRFRWPLAGIASVREVENRWWYGWGIRRTPHGWLYNVAGLAAVEVVFRDGRKVRLGSDDPGGLARAIRRRLTPSGDS